MNARFTEHSAELHRASGALEGFHAEVMQLVEVFRATVDAGKKVLVAGNGGSAAQAQHFSDEMVGRYRADRRPYPVVAMTADGAVLTCIGNDYDFETVFSRQVAALGQPGDLLICLSTSGNSANLLRAAEEARKRRLKIAALVGQQGKLAELADVVVRAPSSKAAIVQELHLHAIHLTCEALEEQT